MAWEEEETETLTEESKVGSVLSVLGLGTWYCVWQCAVWVWVFVVRVCSISPQTFQTGVFMFELRSRNSLCVYAHLSSSIRDRGLYV